MVGTEEGPATGSTLRVTGHGGNPPGSGPFMTVSLSVLEGVVVALSYQTFQCPAAHDCAKALGRLVEGKPIEVARSVTRDSLAQEVGAPLPRHRQICYGVTLLALDDALRQLDDPGTV